MNAIAEVGAFKKALTHFEGQISTVSQQLAVSLPSHISIEKFQRTLMAAVKADPDLLKADRASLINACEKAALDGLLPDKREAALVVFKRNFKDGQGAWQQAMEVAYMPMIYGLRKKILQSAEVSDITAKVVYRREFEEGAFLYEEGTEAMLRHRPLMDLSEEETRDENIIAAYSMATYKDGTKSYEVMRRFEIDKVRECSQTGATRDKRGNPRKPSGPWVDHFGEMAKKTVMRRHSKTLPMSGDLMIDVEGRELDNSATSTARMLAVQPDSPKVLPGRSEPAAEDETETFDPETGEVFETDTRGMTEVDENTARELDDAHASDPQRAKAEEMAAQIETDFGKCKTDDRRRACYAHYRDAIEKLERAYPDLYEVIAPLIPADDPNDGTFDPQDNPVAAEGPADKDRGEAHGDDDPVTKAVNGIRGSIAAAKTLNALGRIETDWTNKVMNGVADDALVRQVDSEFAAKRRELKQAEG